MRNFNIVIQYIIEKLFTFFFKFFFDNELKAKNDLNEIVIQD